MQYTMYAFNIEKCILSGPFSKETAGGSFARADETE
jgi:hypothetical protein